ncbi:type IV secretory system conjugative DNA transfer family protein [Sphingomonas faeni]
MPLLLFGLILFANWRINRHQSAERIAEVCALRRPFRRAETGNERRFYDRPLGEVGQAAARRRRGAPADDGSDRRTLATVRDYLTLAPAGFAALLTAMQASAGAGSLVARPANRQLGKSDREAAGVLSSAQRHTNFLDSPRIVATSAASDFTFAGLKANNATVFLCLPPDRLDTYARWLQLLVSQAFTDIARSTAKPARRCCSYSTSSPR